MGALGSRLGEVRASGAKAFVPYVTGGYPGVDAALLCALEAAGADALEVGIPHSDPIMDGGVVQRASATALEAGATPGSILAVVHEAAVSVPVAVMTYVNPIVRRGHAAFLRDLVEAGVSGAIVPDLPVDEADPLGEVAAAEGIDLVFLAAPGTHADRLSRIASASRGFVYCVATYGVTGVRDHLEGTARTVVDALRPLTDLPLLVGVGIGTPQAATDACGFADGVIVGSAMMRALIDGGPEAAVATAASFRSAATEAGRAQPGTDRPS